MKDFKLMVMAFGLSFWIGLGLTMGVVTMVRFTGVALPQLIIVAEGVGS